MAHVKRIVTDMATLAGGATWLLMSAEFLSLSRDLLLHALGAHFDIQVLLEATSHRFERAYLLREHRGVGGGITSSYQKLGRRK